MTDTNPIFADGITQEYLQECFHYDPVTGYLIWRQRPLSHFAVESQGMYWNKVYPGAEAGWTGKNGYKYLTVKHKKVLYHRAAWFIYYGTLPDQIDHINRDTLDNRIANLRESDNPSNGMNQSMKKNNKSGVTGVCWSERDKLWIAKLKVNKQSVLNRSFANFEDAVKARKDAEKKYGVPLGHGLKTTKKRTNGHARSAWAKQLSSTIDDEVAKQLISLGWTPPPEYNRKV